MKERETERERERDRRTDREKESEREREGDEQGRKMSRMKERDKWLCWISILEGNGYRLSTCVAAPLRSDMVCGFLSECPWQRL